MWAEVKNDTVVNLVQCGEKFARDHDLVKVPDGTHIGMARVSARRWDWPEDREAPEPAPIPEKTIAALTERIEKLEASQGPSGRRSGGKQKSGQGEQAAG